MKLCKLLLLTTCCPHDPRWLSHDHTLHPLTTLLSLIITHGAPCLQTTAASQSWIVRSRLVGVKLKIVSCHCKSHWSGHIWRFLFNIYIHSLSWLESVNRKDSQEKHFPPTFSGWWCQQQTIDWSLSIVLWITKYCSLKYFSQSVWEMLSGWCSDHYWQKVTCWLIAPPAPPALLPVIQAVPPPPSHRPFTPLTAQETRDQCWDYPFFWLNQSW